MNAEALPIACCDSNTSFAAFTSTQQYQFNMEIYLA